ncbi:MAG TPA: hypothetical protein VIT65_15855 [Microlunatus sp.]
MPDAEGLRSEFAAGLRASHGRVPVEGIPRLLRLRRKAGSAVSFSVIDTGGIWLRFYQQGSEEETATTRRHGLARVIDVAARQGEAQGEDGLAFAKVTVGPDRYANAPVAERIGAQVYRAELFIRLGRTQEASDPEGNRFTFSSRHHTIDCWRAAAHVEAVRSQLLLDSSSCSTRAA